MSCPPPPFLGGSFLQTARRALAPGGVMAVNCVTRSNAAFRAAAATLQNTFPQVAPPPPTAACACMYVLAVRLSGRYKVCQGLPLQIYKRRCHRLHGGLKILTVRGRHCRPIRLFHVLNSIYTGHPT